MALNIVSHQLKTYFLSEKEVEEFLESTGSVYEVKKLTFKHETPSFFKVGLKFTIIEIKYEFDEDTDIETIHILTDESDLWINHNHLLLCERIY